MSNLTLQSDIHRSSAKMRSLVCLCLVASLVRTQAQTPAAEAIQLPKNSQPGLSRSMLMTSGTSTGSDGRTITVTATASGDKGADAAIPKTVTIHSHVLDQVTNQKVAVISPVTDSKAVHAAGPVSQARTGSISLARRFLLATPTTPEWAKPQTNPGKTIDDSSATLQQQDAADQIRGLVKPGYAAAAQPKWAQPQLNNGKKIDDSSATVQQQHAHDHIQGLVKPGYAKAAQPDWASQQIDHGKSIGEESATVQQQAAGDQIRGLVNPKYHTSG